MLNKLGYNKLLFILPFDHRSSFTKNLFGIDEKQLTTEQEKKVSELKELIYEGFKKAVNEGINKEYAAILVDEKFGDKILRDARNSGYITLLTTEKSGQKEFALEYGDDFPAHIEKYKPSFIKALIRYNPEDDDNLKKNQQKNLKKLNDYSRNNNYKFLLEVLINPTKNQLSLADNDEKKYDEKIRPKLATEVIKELQIAGIEPDVWKMEGINNKNDYVLLVEAARNGDRNNVGIVILGRAADKNQVEKWITKGADVEGVIGFAVGRTVFEEPIQKFFKNIITKDRAISEISKNYYHFYKVFTDKRQSAIK